MSVLWFGLSLLWLVIGAARMYQGQPTDHAATQMMLCLIMGHVVSLSLKEE